MATKKIRLIDEEATDVTTTTSAGSTLTREDIDKMLDFAEKIDWKLWEILKLTRKAAGE